MSYYPSLSEIDRMREKVFLKLEVEAITGERIVRTGFFKRLLRWLLR